MDKSFFKGLIAIFVIFQATLAFAIIPLLLVCAAGAALLFGGGCDCDADKGGTLPDDESPGETEGCRQKCLEMEDSEEQLDCLDDCSSGGGGGSCETQ